jgi:hypothetical protein
VGKGSPTSAGPAKPINRVGFSRRREMQDDGSGNASRDRNDCAPPPVRKKTAGKYRQQRQYRQFDKDQRHGFNVLAAPSRLGMLAVAVV